MFQTEDSWEESTNIDLLRSLFSQPGLRRHSIVEVADDIPIFHVDVIFSGEAAEHGFWTRLIFRDIALVIRFLYENDVAESRISIQSPKKYDDAYTISQVSKIYLHVSTSGQLVHVCEKRDGTKFPIDVELDANDEIEPLLVWQAHVARN